MIIYKLGLGVGGHCLLTLKSSDSKMKPSNCATYRRWHQQMLFFCAGLQIINIMRLRTMNLTFTESPKQSHTVRSGDLAGKSLSVSRTILLIESISYIYYLIFKSQWRESPSFIKRNLFNIRYICRSRPKLWLEQINVPTLIDCTARHKMLFLLMLISSQICNVLLLPSSIHIFEGII